MENLITVNGIKEVVISFGDDTIYVKERSKVLKDIECMEAIETLFGICLSRLTYVECESTGSGHRHILTVSQK